MRTFALAFATLACVSAPALAEPAATSDKPIVLAQSATISVRDRDRDHHRGPTVVIRDRDRHHGAWMARDRDRGCRVTTIKERHGNRVVVKKIRRC